MVSELTVIGCRAGSPGACGPSSGYLLEVDNRLLLVDCGPGVVASLAVRGVLSKLDAVIVSHAHADHCADLVALAYHRLFPKRLQPLPLFGPGSLAPVLEHMNQVFGIPSLQELRKPISTALPFTPLYPRSSCEIKGVAVTTLQMKHPVETLAIAFPQAGFTYTADGALTDELVEFASNTNVLLAEATYLDGAGRDLDGHGHMTAEQAGALAARARVSHLITTHFASCEERDAICERAAQVFQGTTLAAEPGLRIGLG
jgi:ribonuclease BN (tRNA processing enzyme)